jgi:hypothetical protein
VQKLDGPATVVPTKPGIVVPAPRPRPLPVATAPKIAPDDAPPALVVPPPATRPRVVPEDPAAVDELPDVTAGKLAAPESAAPAAQHMGRGRAFFLAALSALGPAAQNAQANANAHGGARLSDVASSLVGAGAAGVTGAITPRTVQYAQERQQAARAQAIAEQKQAFEAEQAKIALDRANAIKAMRVPPPTRATPLQHVTVGDRVMVFDPETGTLTDSGVHGGSKLKLDHDDKGPFLYDPENPDVPVKRLTGTEAKQFIEVPGYGRMTPGQKYTADQGAERFNIEQSNRVEDRSVADQRDAETRYREDANAAVPYFTKLEAARTAAL